MSQADKFIQHEITVWGLEYIEDLLDRGFQPVLVTVGSGVNQSTKWSWRQPVQPLVQRGQTLTMVNG